MEKKFLGEADQTASLSCVHYFHGRFKSAGQPFLLIKGENLFEYDHEAAPQGASQGMLSHNGTMFELPLCAPSKAPLKRSGKGAGCTRLVMVVLTTAKVLSRCVPSGRGI